MAVRVTCEHLESHPRRTFLLLAGGSSALCTLSPRVLAPSAIGLGGLLWAKSVSAEPITVCIAVASVVFGAIQAHNASDSTSGMLKATLLYQRVMSSQLSAVQQGIADVLQRLGTLEGAVANVSEQTRLGKVLDEVGGASWQYLKVTGRSGYDTYQDWKKSKDVQNELEQIAIVLNRNFAISEARHWLGPTSALYLTAASHTLLAIKYAQGLPPKVMRGYAEQVSQTFDLVEDKKIATSTAALSLVYRDNFYRAVANLAKLGVVVTPAAAGGPETFPVALAFVAIQDYTAPVRLPGESKFKRVIGVDMVETPGPERWSDPRIGETQHFVHTAIIKSNFDKAPGGSGPAVRQFKLAGIETSVVGASPPGTIVERFVAGTAKIREEIAVNDVHRAAAVAGHNQIAGLLKDLNLAAAQMVLCELTLLNVRSSRREVLTQFGDST